MAIRPRLFTFRSGVDHALQPGDVPSPGKHLWDAFGNHEAEISAWWLLRFLQARGSWAPFTRQELQAWYDDQRSNHDMPREDFRFNGLLGEAGDYIRRESDVGASLPTISHSMKDPLVVSMEFISIVHLAVVTTPKDWR